MSTTKTRRPTSELTDLLGLPHLDTGCPDERSPASEAADLLHRVDARTSGLVDAFAPTGSVPEKALPAFTASIVADVARRDPEGLDGVAAALLGRESYSEVDATLRAVGLVDSRATVAAIVRRLVDALIAGRDEE